VINNNTRVIKRKCSVKVIRCYNCQRFGHIAKNCQNQARCEFCSSCHQINESCLREVYCINCSGNHPASASSWQEKLKDTNYLLPMMPHYMSLTVSIHVTIHSMKLMQLVSLFLQMARCSVAQLVMVPVLLCCFLQCTARKRLFKLEQLGRKLPVFSAKLKVLFLESRW